MSRESEWRRARRGDTAVERLDNGGAVLGVADRDANEDGGVRVDVELDVEHEALADIQSRAIGRGVRTTRSPA